MKLHGSGVLPPVWFPSFLHHPNYPLRFQTRVHHRGGYASRWLTTDPIAASVAGTAPSTSLKTARPLAELAQRRRRHSPGGALKAVSRLGYCRLNSSLCLSRICWRAMQSSTKCCRVSGPRRHNLHAGSSSFEVNHLLAPRARSSTRSFSRTCLPGKSAPR